MTGLTARQAEALAAIERHFAATGLMPTRVELMRALGLKSLCATQWLVDRLIERGHLRRLPYRARGLELMDALATPTAEIERALFVPVPFGTFAAPGRATPILIIKRPGEPGQPAPWAAAKAAPTKGAEQQPRHSETVEPGDVVMPTG